MVIMFKAKELATSKKMIDRYKKCSVCGNYTKNKKIIPSIKIKDIIYSDICKKCYNNLSTGNHSYKDIPYDKTFVEDCK